MQQHDGLCTITLQQVIVQFRGWDAEGNQNTHGINNEDNAGAHHGLDLEQLNELQSNSSASSDDDF